VASDQPEQSPNPPVPDILDALPKASFAGVAFPYTKIGIVGGLNYHLHTYLHRPGGEIESLGRKPYEFTFHCEFHSTMRIWANAYPALLATLINLFESEITASLVVPNVGTVQAKAIKWPRNLSTRIRSGESAEFVFLEDSQNQLVVTSLPAFSMAAVPIQAAVLSNAVSTQGLNPSLLDDILSAVTALTALQDQTELMGAMLAQQAEKVMNACATLESLALFNDPMNWPVLDALRDVWASANAVDLDALQESLPIDTFFVPRTMTVSEVSVAIYGDTTHALELLQLNAFDDALAISPGSIVKHYAVLANS
jgi:prophage DNA circulation protein